MCEKESIYKKTSQKIGQRIFDISRFFSNPINSLLLLFNSRYGDQSKWIKNGQKKGIDPKIGVRFFRVLNNTDTPIGFLFNLWRIHRETNIVMFFLIFRFNGRKIHLFLLNLKFIRLFEAFLGWGWEYCITRGKYGDYLRMPSFSCYSIMWDSTVPSFPFPLNLRGRSLCVWYGAHKSSKPM